MSVGDRIAKLRKEQNISQGNLANAVGVSRQAVSKWENGLSLPDSGNLILLAEVLCTDVEYLTTGRITEAIRPPVVIKTIERVEIPVPKVEIQEKIIEKIVEKPVIQYIEKPVIKKVIRYRNHRNYSEYLLTAVVSFILGFIIAYFL
jgi:transcriptional regulator with XRE-family HTH domain